VILHNNLKDIIPVSCDGKDVKCLSFRHERKHFSGLDDDQKLLEVQNVMGLLAYPGSSPRSPYKVWDHYNKPNKQTNMCVSISRFSLIQIGLVSQNSNDILSKEA
jgi:hypothetical protein